MTSRRTLLALAAASALAPAAWAQADVWPAKQPIRIVVPFAPGGTSDALARLLGDKLQQSLKQAVVIDNKGGAGGMIGSDAVAKSPPDGYTLLLGTISSHAINPALQAKMPYDAAKDFAPVFFIGNIANVLLANPAQPMKTVKDVIAAAKARPGTLAFGSAGTGSSQHLSGEMFKLEAGIDITHIPYKGSGPSMQDLIGGQIPLSFDTALVALPQVQAGKVRAIAVTTARRAKVLPDVPTMAESGVAGFDVASWQAIFAPAGTPAPIVQKLHEELTRIVAQPDVAARLEALGVDYAPMSPEQFGAFQRAEIAKWTRLGRQANLKL
jgi:tripartite-type tricarboxylate transporter receptor subunit TctC